MTLHSMVEGMKMSERTSNFRISLDLFELVTFGTNYGLQTANETVTRCPNVALRYFGPFPEKRLLEVTLRYFLVPTLLSKILQTH